MRAIGRIGLVNPWLLGAPVAVGGAFVCAWGCRRVWSQRRDLAPRIVGYLARPAPALAAICCAAAVGLIAIWTAAPEVQYDALSAKEWLPALWAREGHIFIPQETPQMFVTGSALDAFLPGHTVGGAATARYSAFFLGGVLCVLVRRLVRPWVSRGSAAILSAVFLATPHLLWQMSTAFDDLELALAALALAALAVGLQPSGVLDGVLMGILVGSAVNAKLHLAVFAGVVACVWLLRVHGKRRGLHVLAGAVAGAFVTAGTVLIERWVEFGNPVLPALNAVFRSREYPPINESYNFPFAADGGLHALLDFLPSVVFAPTTYVEATPPGAYGLLPFVLLIYLLAGWCIPTPGGLAVWAGTAIAVAAWWIEVRYLRYLIPYFVVALVMVAPVAGRVEVWATAAFRTAVRRRTPSAHGAVSTLFLAAMFAAAPATVLAGFWNVPGRIPIATVFGAEAADAYQLRSMPGVAAIQAINRLTPSDSLTVVDPALVYQRTLLEGRRNLLPMWEFVKLTTWFIDRGDLRGPLGSASAWRGRGVSWAAISEAKLDSGDYDPRVTAVIRAAGRAVWQEGDVVLVEIPRR